MHKLAITLCALALLGACSSMPSWGSRSAAARSDSTSGMGASGGSWMQPGGPTNDAGGPN